MTDWPKAVRSFERMYGDGSFGRAWVVSRCGNATVIEVADAAIEALKAEVERLREAVCTRCTVSSPGMCDECEYHD